MRYEKNAFHSNLIVLENVYQQGATAPLFLGVLIMKMDNSWQPADDLIDETECMATEEYLEWLEAQCPVDITN